MFTMALVCPRTPADHQTPSLLFSLSLSQLHFSSYWSENSENVLPVAMEAAVNPT